MKLHLLHLHFLILKFHKLICTYKQEREGLIKKGDKEDPAHHTLHNYYVTIVC